MMRQYANSTASFMARLIEDATMIRRCDTTDYYPSHPSHAERNPLYYFYDDTINRNAYYERLITWR